MTVDYRANLGAHRRQLPCEHCGTEGRNKHDRTCPKAKRGRTSRSRGNAYEREVAKKLGLERVGQFGGPEDVRGDWLNLQCKNGGAFPERIWRWLQALPVDQRLRGVVIGDAPGPGTKRRNVIVLDLDDFADWFGKAIPEMDSPEMPGPGYDAQTRRVWTDDPDER